MDINRIKRHTLPTKYDEAPCGTLCECYITDDDPEPKIYIQISKEETKPQWETLGAMLEIAFKSHIHNDVVIAAILDIVHNPDAGFSLLCDLL